MRVLGVGCVVLVLGAGTLARAQPPDQGGQQAQALFRDLLLKDQATASGVRRLLSTNAGFVSRAPQFADLTGDGKMDAVVTVENGGAAGVVAAYVLSADGAADGSLRAVFRSQSLYQGRTRLGAPTLTVIVPAFARGDDVCCARRSTERDYAWDPRTQTLTRRATRTVPAGGSPRARTASRT
jgi:hypothetical protein